MGVQKKTRKFALAKRAISMRDNRLYDIANFHCPGPANSGDRKQNQEKTEQKVKNKKDDLIREA
jgi:U3 small nucleolar RNA-associated protein 24